MDLQLNMVDAVVPRSPTFEWFDEQCSQGDMEGFPHLLTYE